MKNLFTLLFLITFSLCALAQKGTLTGKVTDDNGQPLPEANVLVVGMEIGTSTDFDGTYTLMLDPGTYSISTTYVGFQSLTQEVEIRAGATTTLDFTLATGTLLDAVIISGSKRPEKITESPATIETVFAREIAQYAGNPAELVARQKGIDYFRAGIATPAFNIRGFNSNFNSKNLQVTDGRFSTLVATGLPFGPLDPVIKEDIERFEIILGPNAALYGPNAHNGLLNTITKDPRTSAGTIFASSVGVTGSQNTEPILSQRFRHAQVISDKFAFKTMFEYTEAEEFRYDDSVYIDRLDAMGRSALDPNFSGADGVKEAYLERNLDEDVDFFKAAAGLYFTPSDGHDIIFNYNFSNSNYLSPTNVGRNQIRDWQIHSFQLMYTSEHWFAQVYHTLSSTEDTYAIDQFTKNYYTLLDAGVPSDLAEQQALDPALGAIFTDDSKRWNAELQYNNQFGDLEVIVGAQVQRDLANSENTYLIEQDENTFFNGESIEVDQYGGYAHLTYNFPAGWRLLAAARADYHDVYEFNLVPKFGVLNVQDWGTVRLTYGQGIAAPTILNMFGDLFAGLILGNSDGFTLVDGSTVPAQEVEKIQTFELGYRGAPVKNKLFLDFNAYYNIAENFLSPLTVLGVATHRGDARIDQVQSGFAVLQGLVASYVNFGEINSYGADLSATLQFNDQWSAILNYSYFDYSFDENDLENNDFNNDGEVNFLDFLINSPNHKGGLGINYNGSKFSAGIYGRWVESYNYFSSFQIASETIDGETWRGVPIVENARSADTYNYGPLGGFVTFDLNLGYQINDMFTVNVSVVNVSNQQLREFTAVAPTRRIATLELRANLPAINPNK